MVYVIDTMFEVPVAVLMKIEDYWNVMLCWVCSSDVAKDCSAFIFRVKQTRETPECWGNYIPDDSITSWET